MSWLGRGWREGSGHQIESNTLQWTGSPHLPQRSAATCAKLAWRDRARGLGCTQGPVESVLLWALSPRLLRGEAPVGTELEGGVLVVREWVLGFIVGVLLSVAVIR